MKCPLCYTDLRSVMLKPSLVLVSCPLEQCVYPMNMSMDEIKAQGLLRRVLDELVMGAMGEKLKEAGLEQRMVDFMRRPLQKEN